MATIGLDKLFYSKITEDDSGNETYGTPQVLAKAMTADLSVELNEATLFFRDRVHQSLLCLSISVAALQIGSSIPSF